MNDESYEKELRKQIKELEPEFEKQARKLEKEWRANPKFDQFDLLTPVIEGPYAGEELVGKFARIVEFIDPDMTPEVKARVRKVLQVCPGLTTKGKQGGDQAKQKWNAHQDQIRKLAVVASEIHKRKRINPRKNSLNS